MSGRCELAAKNRVGRAVRPTLFVKRCLWSSLGAGYSKIHYLADLPAGRVITWAELQAACPATIPGDDAMRVGRLDVAVEGVTLRHVPEGRRPRRGDRPALRQHDDLAQLRSRDVVTWAVFQAARPAIVPGDDPLVVCRLDDPVEGVSGRHVLEGGSGGHVYGPALGQHYYLGELSPGGVVEGAEGAVPVARYDPVAIEIAHRLVEVVGRQHVAEADRTCGRDGGGRNGGRDGGVCAGGCVGSRGRGGRGRGLRLPAGRELERANVRPPAGPAGDGHVFVHEPEGAVVGRVHVQRGVVSPPARTGGLGAGAFDHRCLALGHLTERIAH